MGGWYHSFQKAQHPNKPSPWGLPEKIQNQFVIAPWTEPLLMSLSSNPSRKLPALHAEGREKPQICRYFYYHTLLYYPHLRFCRDQNSEYFGEDLFPLVERFQIGTGRIRDRFLHPHSTYLCEGGKSSRPRRQGTNPHRQK